MNIKQIRESRGLTQEELANRLQIGRSAVAMWETGQSMPRADILVKMCAILSCTADELLGIEKGAS